MSDGKLLAIAVRSVSRGAMEELASAEITTDSGVNSDVRGKPGGRQVTVLSLEAWEAACAELNQEIPWTTRRANLLVEGLELADSMGGLIRVGDVVLKITGETEPCRLMEKQVPGLKQALVPDWRGGVCCQVISGGSIQSGDKVLLE